MHVSFFFEMLRCNKLALHQLEKCTTEESYDWYVAKSLKRASMAVSNLTYRVDGSALRHYYTKCTKMDSEHNT